MAAKYYATYYDTLGRLCRVEIHKDGYSGALIQFRAKEGVNISWQGKNDIIYNPILGSTATISILVDSLSIQGIVTDLLTSSENTLTVKFTIDGTLEWAGYVIQDASTYQDYNYTHKYIFEVRAVDGIGRLKGIDYATGGAAYSGKDNFLSMVFNCLGKLSEVQTFWGASDEYLSTAINWTETANMTTGNPFALTRVNQEIFYELEEDGTEKIKSCYDALNEILKAWGAFIMLSGGRWWIRQWGEMDETNITTYDYSKSESQLSTGALTLTDTVDRTAKHRISGGNYGYLPGLREVDLTYQFFEQNNFLQGRTFANASFSSLVELADFSDGQLRLRLKGTVYARISGSSGWDPHNLIFRFQIKYGSYYLKRTKRRTHPGDGSYNTMTWTTVRSYVEFYTPAIPDTVGNTMLSFPIDITSPSVTEGGAFEFGFGYFGAVNSDFTTYSNGSISYYDDFLPDFLYVYSGDEETRPSDKISVLIENDTSGYSDVFEIQTIIGQGPSRVTMGTVEVTNGTNWFEPDTWQVGGTGTVYDDFQTLLAKQIMSLQKSPIKTVDGTFKGDISAHNRINYDSELFAFQSGRWDTYNNLLTGQWVKLAKVATTSTIDDIRIVPVRVQIPPTTTGNVNEPGRVQAAGAIATQSITAITSGITSGSTITSIDISAMGIPAIFAGDILRIFDPTTGEEQYLVAAEDVAAGDTTVTVVSATTTVDLNAGSVVTVTDKFKNAIRLNEFLVFDVYKGNEAVSSGSSNIFFRPPYNLRGRAVKSIHAALYDAATGTKTTQVIINKDGSPWQQFNIVPGDNDATLELTDTYFYPAKYDIQVEYIGTGTSPNGLVVTLEIGQRSAYYWVTPTGQIWYW